MRFFSLLKLKLNKSKSKIMNVDVKIRKYKLTKFPDLVIDNTCKEAVKNFNYLGMTIDRGLRLDVQLKKLCQTSTGQIIHVGKAESLYG